jgi:serine/threonine protein kinase
MNTDDQHDFLSPRRGPAPLTPSELAEQLATDYPLLTVHPVAPLVGGMGAVYRATLTNSAGPRPVAIKVLHWHLMDDPAFTARFQREQALLRQLDHPHIVKLHFTGHTAEGLPFLAMDWIEGRSLTEFTQPGSTTDRQLLLRIADDLCSAAHYAHEKGILHRDLKPQNIIVTPDGRAIVLDFGIARSLRPGHTLTQPGNAPGTHGYIAPEVLAGEKPDARADIYSLGIIIYQILMKKLPDVFAARPSEHSLDPRFDEIVMKAAASEREKRYASAEALRGALVSIRRTGKLEAHTMNNDSTPNRPDPKSIVIEYDDDWITIKRMLPNGQWIMREFSSEPELADIKAILGSPDHVETETPKEGGSVQVSYYWDDLGIRARSTGDVLLWSNDMPWPGDNGREQRIQHMALMMITPGEVENSSSPTRKWENQRGLPYTGLLRVSGIEFLLGSTADQFRLMKQKGEPLRQHLNFFGVTDHSLSIRGKTGVGLRVSSDSSPDWSAKPIHVVDLYFEQWTKPTGKLANLKLAEGEFMLNAAS